MVSFIMQLSCRCLIVERLSSWLLARKSRQKFSLERFVGCFKNVLELFTTARTFFPYGLKTANPTALESVLPVRNRKVSKRKQKRCQDEPKSLSQNLPNIDNFFVGKAYLQICPFFICNTNFVFMQIFNFSNSLPTVSSQAYRCEHCGSSNKPKVWL